MSVSLMLLVGYPDLQWQLHWKLGPAKKWIASFGTDG